VPPLLPSVETLGLVDHHCHGVVPDDLDRSGFESLLTEAEAPGPLGGTLFDSAIGFAVRRWCAPVLDLPPHASPEDYLRRRAELGAAEVNRRFLRTAGIEALCLDTGFAPGSVVSPAEMGVLADATAHEIVRLEQVAEEVAVSGPGAKGFADAFRVGLALPGERPADTEVAAAAGRWLGSIEAGGPVRLADVTLQTFLIWCGADLGLPIQFHVGYGDADVDLHRCDPLLLTDLIRAVQPTGTPIMLLHNYPFHRHAGYLAQVFPHVFADVGLATHNLGHRAPALVAETLELAPYGKFLFSTDAFGLPELYHLGSLLFRQGLSDYLRSGLDDGAWTEDDAARIARLAGGENARRVYRLEPR
jgi:hypothetical protein